MNNLFVWYQLNVLNSSSIKSKRKYFARFGLAAKATLYSLTGLLVFLAAFQIGGQSTTNTDKKGILDFLVHQPAGKGIVLLLAFGSISYAFWRYLQTFADTDRKGKDMEGIGKRITYLFSGITYSAIAFLAFKTSLSKRDDNSDSTTQNVAGNLLDKPYGDYLVLGWALVLFGVGIYQIWYGLSGKFEKHVNSGELSFEVQGILRRAGKIGYIARGMVWLILGFLLTQAALHKNPSEAGDTSTVFGFIKDSAWGVYLQAAMGAGLICYGVLNYFRAFYEKFG
jgi:hypothetical protein